MVGDRHIYEHGNAPQRRARAGPERHGPAARRGLQASGVGIVIVAERCAVEAAEVGGPHGLGRPPRARERVQRRRHLLAIAEFG